MTKRANGEGSIYQRKNPKRWEAFIRLEDGGRKYFYGKTRKEVRDKYLKALEEQQKGTLITAGPQTVGQFLTDWLENTQKRQIRPRTYERYREAIHLHLIPALGRHQLQKLTVRHLQAFYTAKEKEGLAPATIIYYHSVLHNALSAAVKQELVARNICDLASPPRKVHHEIQPLTEEQAQRLLVAIGDHKWEALFTLALATGLRRGEILGLKWQDINVATSTLQVRRILSRVPTQAPGRVHVYVEAEPKTHKSRRSVVIAPFALEALMRHKAQQLQLKAKAGTAWQERDYVFCTLIGNPLNPNHVIFEFKKLLKKAGLPDIRFHDLRHTAASLLLTAGVNPKIVQEILGHTQISMTMDIYSHVLPGMQQEAMKKLQETLKREEDDDDGLAGAGVPAKPKRK